MPNWCNNHAIVRHEDLDMVAKLVTACNEEQLFNTFVPRPPEEEENWYNWNISNWGTKWEASHYDETFAGAENPHEAVLAFDTAWAPPIEFYNRLVEQGFKVEACYYEPGMNFCGEYNDGVDEYVEIEGGSDWVQEFVPEKVNEIFAIAENMEIWEQEQDDG